MDEGRQRKITVHQGDCDNLRDKRLQDAFQTNFFRIQYFAVFIFRTRMYMYEYEDRRTATIILTVLCPASLIYIFGLIKRLYLYRV